MASLSVFFGGWRQLSIIIVFADSIKFHANMRFPDRGAIPRAIIPTFSHSLENVSSLPLECVNSLLEARPLHGDISFLI
jgi:hypothetical protein